MLAAFAGPAAADPITIVATLAPIIGGTAAVFVANYGMAIVTLGYLANSSASAKRKQRRAAAAARAEYNAGLSDRTATVLSTEAPHPYIYGTATVGGSVVAIFSGNKPAEGVLESPTARAGFGALPDEKTVDALKHIVMIVAAHEVESIHEVQISGKTLGELTPEGYATSEDYSDETTKIFNDRTVTLDAQARYTPAKPPSRILSAYESYVGGGQGADIQKWRRVEATISGAYVQFPASLAGKAVRCTYEYKLLTSRVRVSKHLGGPTDPADAYLIANSGGKWTANHVLRGFAYVVVTLDLNLSEFQGGLPEITFNVSGKKVLDPRNGVTAYSENPALCVADYLQSPMWASNTRISIIQSDLIAAANVCDQQITWPADLNATSTYRSFGGRWLSRILANLLGKSLVPTRRYSCNGAFMADADAEAILLDLVSSMAGYAYVSGGWRILAGTWTTPVAHIGQQDTVTPVEIVQAGAGRDSVFNGVRGRYVPRSSGTPTDFKPYQNEVYLAADGEPLWDDVSYPFTDTEARCVNLARIATERARSGLTIKVGVDDRFWGLQPGDRVTLDSAEYQFVSKTFRVNDWSFSSTEPLTLVLQEDSPEAYDEVDATLADQTPNTAMPNPFKLPKPGTLAAESGTAQLMVRPDGSIATRIKVSWAPSTNLFVLTEGSVELQARLDDGDVDGQIYTVVQRADQTVAIFDSFSDGQHVLIRARFTTPVADGPWENLSTTVIGKSEPPPAFDFFTVSAQPDGTRDLTFGYYTQERRPPDWRGAQIRYTPGYVADPVWEQMTPLQGDTTHYTASPVEVNAPLAGTWTFACRSMDTTNNLGPALVETVTLSARRTGNVYMEFYEQQEGWLGTLAGFNRSGGILEATGAVTWASGGTWATAGAWNSTPTSPAVYTTPARDLLTSLAGQVDAIVDADGTTVLEMSTSADNITWSAWGSPSATLSARYVMLRVTVTANGTFPIPIVRSLSWNVNADLKQEYLNNLVPASLTGVYRIGVGDIRVPLTNTYTALKRLGVLIEDSRAGSWTYQRIDNTLTYGPRIQLKLNGVLTDPAKIDIDLEGL